MTKEETIAATMERAYRAGVIGRAEMFKIKIVLFIAGYVAGSKEIDELSFRQRVDENYKETYHLHDLLTEYHKKLWWYITQCDYNLYFHNGKVYTKYTDIFTEGSNGLG